MQRGIFAHEQVPALVFCQHPQPFGEQPVGQEAVPVTLDKTLDLFRARILEAQHELHVGDERLQHMALQARGHGIETGDVARPESLARCEEVSLVACRGCIAECGKRGTREEKQLQ